MEGLTISFAGGISMGNIKIWLLRKCVKIINDNKANAAPKVNGVVTCSDVPYIEDSLEWHKLDVYSPAEFSGKPPAIIYIHGGGWSLSDKKHFRHFCQVIAANGYIVFNTNYRLAPEYRHPAQLMDILKVMGWVKLHASEYGADPTKIFLFGDSSGAHLASLAACVCTNIKLAEFYKIDAPLDRKNIYGCVLFCGSYNIESCRETSFPFIDDFVYALLGTKNIVLYKDIDKLSAIKNITSDFPPCFISDSTGDALINESRNLIQVLDKNGVKHKDLLLDDIGKASAHEYQIQYDKPVFKMCIEKILTFLEECCTSADGINT
ncbi:MAG TPA: alpha/beta hydrolase [Ignavibacteriales bacterium]|nr:alpha/beta hydrolase [Ignavibacteriales bacterium]